MRKFKFRAWNTLTTSWSDCIDIINPCFPKKCHQVVHELEDADNIKLMQYTGLKDKNGVEIYEGDIIEFEHIYIDKYTLEPTKRYYKDTVKYISPCYHIGDYPLDSWNKNTKVIGNIYQHKELLETK